MPSPDWHYPSNLTDYSRVLAEPGLGKVETMSLRANIEHLAAAQGIEAVAVDNPSGAREFRGDSRWSAVLDGALSLLGKTDEPTIRLVVGKHTVVVQTEKEETVAVVLPTGHAIAKSLRRMIRRMSRKVRAPLQPGAAPTAADLEADAAEGSDLEESSSSSSSGAPGTGASGHGDESRPSWG